MDIDTEGLLLLTNDGVLAHELLSPRKHVDKTYFVRIAGNLSDADVKQLEQGMDIGDEKLTLPAKVSCLEQFPDGLLYTSMKRGDKAKLAYSVLPNNTSDSLKFASDNKRVAKVNSNGVVTAVGTGNATITIMSLSLIHICGECFGEIAAFWKSFNRADTRCQRFDQTYLHSGNVV